MIPTGAGSLPGPAPLPASDPNARSQALKWADWRVPTLQLAFRVNGVLGPASWAELSAKGASAFRELGLEFVDELKPKFDGASILGPMAELGYGYLEGEAGLAISSTTLFYGPMFSSFVVAVQLWVDPPLARGTVDRIDLPHTWKVSVAAGRVQSMNRTGGRHAPFRSAVQPEATDPALGWVAARVLDRLR